MAIAVVKAAKMFYVPVSSPENQNTHGVLGTVYRRLRRMKQGLFLGLTSASKAAKGRTAKVNRMFSTTAARSSTQIPVAQVQRECQALYDGMSAINSSQDLETIVLRILDNIGQIIPHNSLNVMLISETSGDATIDYWLNSSSQDIASFKSQRFALTLSTLSTILRTGEPLLVEDTTTDPLWNRDLQSGLSVRSYVGAPLMVRGRVIGFLNLNSNVPGFFSETHVAYLKLFAEQIALAIGNARLRRDAEIAAAIIEARVTERTAIRTAELQAINQRLTAADLARSKFISHAAHEMRTPLTTLKNLLYLIDRGSIEKRAKYLENLKFQINSMNSLVENILDLSRLENQCGKFTHSEVDLNMVVERAVAVCAPRAEATGLALTFTPERAMPLINGHEGYLEQAVTNLIANAIKYTQQGSVTISTAFDRQARQVVLTVKDTGSGIDPRDIPNLFKPFYRGQRDANSPAVPGTGLGLSIVHEVISQHNGRITVSSQLQQGTTFTVGLPCDDSVLIIRSEQAIERLSVDRQNEQHTSA